MQNFVRMALVSAPFPNPFLPCPGEPVLPLVTWMKMFRNYMLVINATGDSRPEARKQALLLHCLGTEGQRLFYTLPNTGQVLRDQLVENIANPRIRERLLLESKLTLEIAITIAT